MAILFLARAEDWKGPLGPAGNLWPHLIYSCLERIRKFKKKVTDRRTDARTHEAAFNLRLALDYFGLLVFIIFPSFSISLASCLSYFSIGNFSFSGSTHVTLLYFPLFICEETVYSNSPEL